MQSDKVVALEAQIQSLSDLQNRLQTLRRIPPLLLKTPTASTQTPRPEFLQVKEIADTIRTEAIQEALGSARDSLQADTSDLNPNLRRENRKRRYVSETNECGCDDNSRYQEGAIARVAPAVCCA